jgi:hypothetical protein
MGVIQIREAKREGARLVIGLQGISGSGKTYTALQLAYGMANFQGKKVGLICTENRRGSLYADSLRHPETGQVDRFLIGDLTPPFSPSRYVEAIQEFEQAGVDVLVIDSVSHEWAGQGGCYDIAKNTSKRIDDWLTAKNEHKRFMSAMLQSPMHVIACIREAPKTDFKDPKNPKSLGLMPIQESQFVFELTASLQMWNSGRDQAVLKCPAELMPILGRGKGYLTATDGLALRRWVDGADAQIDPGVARWRDRLQAVTEQGEAFVAEAWGKVPEPVRAQLGEAFREQILKSARAFDAQRAAASGADPDLDDLNSRVMGGATEGDKEE